MFLDRDIKGNRLPPKTLCLTYDDGPGETAGDGPGPRTLELAHYLYEQGIRAAFFVVGSHAECYRHVLPLLQGWGHLIGNHTYSHPGLVALAEGGGDVIGEVAKTDALIRPYVSASGIFLRAPYGNWRQKDPQNGREDLPTSIVANILNRSGRFPNYVGPVNWDISAADFDYWRRGATAAECAEAYLQKIEHLGRGIVLMHDSSELEAMRANNRTLELTKRIVPVLQQRGYRFVGLDQAIPSGGLAGDV
jgi:peptidoglycan/xylan/chitin deacetylase (PgdA/CDA1 family)